MVCKKCNKPGTLEDGLFINNEYYMCDDCLDSCKMCKLCGDDISTGLCPDCDWLEPNEAINSFDPLHRMQAEHDFFVLPTNSIIVYGNDIK